MTRASELIIKEAGCRPKVPTIVKHCVARIIKERGYSKEKAFKICVGYFEDIGILKKGKMDLTQKGKRMSEKHYQHPAALDLSKVK